MRLEADLAEDSGVEGSGVPGFLSNPLAEAPSTVLSTDAAPRFNYYTDPMNAFSSDKRSSVNVRPAPEYLPPPPSFGGPSMVQFSSPYPESANPQMSPFPTQALPTAYRNPVWNGPRGTNIPFHPPGGGAYPSPRFESPGGPSYNSAPGGPSYNSAPGGPSYNSAPGGPSYNSAPGGPSYNSAPGMNQWRNHSPYPSSEYNPNHSPAFRNSPNSSQGRGRGSWNNTGSPVPGRGRGRGSSSHGRRYNENTNFRPEQLYKMSMVEDPWKSLKPIIWYSTYTRENSKPWNPSKSTSTKREGPPAVFTKSSSSGPSLAEYLASAFNEAANTEENV
ncbi:hypothetical protein L195_g023225 [Trifolium pratense]|uniref:Uncharacterized protein n=1 Tax=Trifolium pratense TaxID=57577 RepID=A0A2K3NA97_TRIPR|nr:hypothetical protein L195_g023225 [Trifolium pratense]